MVQTKLDCGLKIFSSRTGCGLGYKCIHSTRRGDEAIVYDNKQKQKTHYDSIITILPGRAHVLERVFEVIPILGWGSAWRDNRGNS
jgi:hypothetical protein